MEWMEEEKKLSVYILGPLQILGRDCACDARRNPNHCQQIKKIWNKPKIKQVGKCIVREHFAGVFYA